MIYLYQIHTIIAIVDVAKGILKEDEVALSMEVIKALNVEEGYTVKVDMEPPPETTDYILEKLHGKELNYEMVDFHTSRPGHDLRYALSGEYMKSLGWEPKVSLQDRISEVVSWSLEHQEWIEL